MPDVARGGYDGSSDRVDRLPGAGGGEARPDPRIRGRSPDSALQGVDERDRGVGRGMTRPRRRRRILSLLGKVGRALAYVASLPERAIHSTAAVRGGASRLASDITLPSALRRTPFYKFVIGNFQRFIIEGLGRVKGAYLDAEGRLPKDFLVRKTVGDFVEAAGIVAVHYSPLWFFALVGGAASGSRRFLKRVVRELKKDGALPPDA